MAGAKFISISLVFSPEQHTPLANCTPRQLHWTQISGEYTLYSCADRVSSRWSWAISPISEPSPERPWTPTSTVTGSAWALVRFYDSDEKQPSSLQSAPPSWEGSHLPERLSP